MHGTALLACSTCGVALGFSSGSMFALMVRWGVVTGARVGIAATAIALIVCNADSRLGRTVDKVAEITGNSGRLSIGKTGRHCIGMGGGFGVEYAIWTLAMKFVLRMSYRKTQC